MEERRLSRSTCGQEAPLALCTSVALSKVIAHLTAWKAGIISVMSVMALLFTWGSSLWREESQKGTSNNCSSQKNTEVTQGQTFLLQPISHSLLPHCCAHGAASGSGCVFRSSSSSSPKSAGQKCQCLAPRTMHRYRCAEPLPFLKGIKKGKQAERRNKQMYYQQVMLRGP